MKNKLIYISEVENILRFLFFWVNCFFKASLITKVTNRVYIQHPFLLLSNMKWINGTKPEA